MRKVEIRFEEDVGAWRIYWSGTDELADPGVFGSLMEAGTMARQLMGEPLRRERLRVVGRR